MNKLTWLKSFINDNCIERVPPGYFLKGCREGEAYTWQFYLRRAIFDQFAIHTIASEMNEMSYEFGKVQLAGMESAGPPILSAIQVCRAEWIDGPLNTFAIRKEQKKYGLCNWFEGDAQPGVPVVLVDDISNSKSTLMRARAVCEAHGLEVVGAMTIVNKKNEKLDIESGLPVKSLFCVDDFDLEWKGTPAEALDYISSRRHALYQRVNENTLERIA